MNAVSLGGKRIVPKVAYVVRKRSAEISGISGRKKNLNRLGIYSEIRNQRINDLPLEEERNVPQIDF